MEPNVKNALSFALNAMIELAEASGTEVRMTFQSVAMVVKPGRSARELMEEFERNEKLVKVAEVLVPLLMNMFSPSEFRRLCRYLPNSNNVVDEFPGEGESPKRQFAEGMLILCVRGIVTEDSFWSAIERERSGRTREIRSMRERVMATIS